MCVCDAQISLDPGLAVKSVASNSKLRRHQQEIQYIKNWCLSGLRQNQPSGIAFAAEDQF